MITHYNSKRINYICLSAALGGLLFGFDTAVISGVVPILEVTSPLSSSMQGWLVSCGLVGCMLGVLTTGLITDRVGRKKTIALSGLLFLASSIGCGFSSSLSWLITARLIGGIGVGMASVISPMIIAEFAPPSKRGRMIAYYQLAITVGILLAYFSNALWLTLSHHDFDNGLLAWLIKVDPWRAMFLAMAVPSILFLILLGGIPESPRWLVSTGNLPKAAAVLKTLMPPDMVENELEAMADAYNASCTGAVGKLSLSDPSLRIPLLIGVVLAVFQQCSGINAVIYYGPSIFNAAGLGTGSALAYQVIIGIVNLVFTLIAIKWSDKYGRKSLLITGLAGIVLSLFFVGLLFYGANTHGVLLLILLLLFIACFAFSLGPVTWIVINEIFPTAVRVKAVSLCTITLWVTVWLVGQFFPWLLNNLGSAGTFWLFGGFSLFHLLFCWKMIRETSGKSLEDIQNIYYSPH